MLRKATRLDIETYGDMIWEMVQKPENCGYPVYYDGIKTKNDMINFLNGSIQGENDKVFIYEANGKVCGIVGYFTIKYDRYIQMNFCSVQYRMKDVLQELWQKIDADEEGCVYFGFPGENKEAIAYMEENNCKKADESWNHSFFFSEYSKKPVYKQVERITKEKYDDFLQIYKTDENTYWNADRIYKTFDRWNLYIAYEEKKPVSVLVLQKGDEQEEIFGISRTVNMTDEHYEAMMNTALNESKERGVKFLTYFSEEWERGCLEKLGFHCIGKYVLYIREM